MTFLNIFTRCKICNRLIWFDNVRNWAYPTEFDCCNRCWKKYSVYDAYAVWKYKDKELLK